MMTALMIDDQKHGQGRTEIRITSEADTKTVSMDVSPPRGGRFGVDMTKAETLELGRQLLAAGESL